MTPNDTRETSPENYLAAAWACFDDGRLEDAIHLARQSIQGPPSIQANGSAALAWFLLCKGSNREAQSLLETSLERYPEHAPLHWYLGVLHQRERRLEAAADALTTAVTLAPQLDEAATTLAWVLVDLSRLDDAARYVRQALHYRERPDRLALLGWILLRLEAFDEAIAQFAKALSLELQRTQTRRHMADALQHMGRSDEAQQILADGLALSPDDGDLLQAQVQLFIDARRTQEARAACHSLLRLHPNEGTNWYLLARVLAQRKRQAPAARALARALRLASPQQPELWQKIGWLALEFTELRIASQAVQQVLELAPHDPNTAILAALVGEASGDLPTAAEHAERAVVAAKHSAHAWRALAQIRARQDRVPEAEQALQTALELEPHDTSDTYRQLGWLCFTDHRRQAAIAAFEAAVHAKASNAEAWYGLAQAYRADGQYLDALRAIRQTLRLRDDWVGALVAYGDLLLHEGPDGWSPAIAQFAKALSLEPQQTQTRRHMADALQRMGRSDDAQQVLADGLALTPNNGDLLQAQTQLLIDARRTQEARAACHRLLRLHPNEGTNWYLLARVLAQRKRQAPAARALARALRLAGPQQPDLWQKIGWLALEFTELRIARQAAQQVLELTPHDPNADILAALVGEASGDLPAAAEHAERAVVAAKHSAHAWRALAQVRARQDRIPEAEQALQTALELEPHDTSDTYRQLGWLCFTDHRHQAAIAAFEAAVHAQASNATAWYGLAQAYRADGQYLDALRAIRQTLRLRDEWSDRTLRGQIIHEQVYHFLHRKWNNLHGTPQANIGTPAPDSDTARAATPSYDYVVCSLSTQSHVPLMNTLAQSVRKHFTGNIYLLVVDSDDASLIPADTTLVRLRDVIAPAVWQELQGRYNILELCCVLKSYLMRFLAKTVDSPIIYLDADTYLLGPLAPLLPPTPDFSVLLTPHLITPLPGDSHAEEIGMLSVGVYNGGMVGMGLAEDGIRFLDWWADRVTRYAYDSREQGVFTDQKWLDLVPCFFQNVHVSRAPGINVGHWRVCSEQDFEEDATGRLMFRGQAVTHMHMSGFKTQRPELLAQHLLPPVSPGSPLGKFLQRYASEVIQNKR